MHHLYPLAKGDQLCPLGFHPQVRWPTRCKRCFRDYKEHGGKRGGDDIAASSPSLSESSNAKAPGRTWTSSQNLSTLSDNNGSSNGIELRKRPSSWTSTPDLEDSEKVTNNEKSPEVSVSIQIPQRRHTTILDAREHEDSVTVRKPPIPPSTSKKDDDFVIHNSDSLAERVRKMNMLKKQNSTERESSRERSVPRKNDREESPSIEKDRESKRTAETESKKADKKTTTIRKQDNSIKTKQDVEFLIRIKENASHKQDDNVSTTTETTDTTLVGSNDQELEDEMKILRKELETMKTRAERAERDKSDILLRRLASIDTGPNRTAASEALKLQQKVNELKTQVEDLKDDKRCLSIKVKELEQDLNVRPAKSAEEELRRKLQAAEQLCEELMDENEDIKKELKGMEQEIDEMHDNFREDQVDEYTTVRKELEQTTKNCRILSFKLKKSERKIEQLEVEKQALGVQNSTELAIKVKKLEEDLKLANELTRKLQAEAEQSKSPGKKKAPSLGVIGKSTSADGKYSRESLTRGGSQEDPEQLLRDLRDSLEREADLKEQLKFAEEESRRLRQRRHITPKENRGIQTEIIEILCIPSGTQTCNFSKDAETSLDHEYLLNRLHSVACSTDKLLMKDASTDTHHTISTDASVQICFDTFDCSIQTEPFTCSLQDASTFTDETLYYNTTRTVQTNTDKLESQTISTQTYMVTQSNSFTQTDEKLLSAESPSTSTMGGQVAVTRGLSPCRSFSLFAFPQLHGFFFPTIVSPALVSAISGRKLSPNARLTPEPPVEHDEGISDEDDPAELRVLLELNEQEASVLRLKVEDLEAQNTESKKQIQELHEKLKANSSGGRKLPSILSKSSSNASSDKKLKVLEDEMSELRKSIVEKDNSIERLQAEIVAFKSKSGKNLTRTGSLEDKLDLKRQLEMVIQEASILRGKISTLEEENDKLSMENKKLQLQSLRKSSISNEKNISLTNNLEMVKIKEVLSKIEKERDELNSKLKIIVQEANEKLPVRTPKRVTDLTPKAHLKKWVEELEDEIKEMRAIVLNSGGDNVRKLESAKNAVEKELKEVKDQLNSANIELKKIKSIKDNTQAQTTKVTDLENKLKKSEEESTKLNSKIKELEDKIKKQDIKIKQTEVVKTSLDNQIKREKDKFSALEKDYEKEKKERERCETKAAELDDEVIMVRKSAEKSKVALEKEIQELKTKVGSKTDVVSSKKLQELKNHNDELQTNLSREAKRYSELNGKFERLSEEHVLIKAQLATEKQNMQTEQNASKQKQSEVENLRTEKTEIVRRLKDAEKKIGELESRNIKTGAMQYEKNMLKSSLVEKEREMEKLKKENEMNRDVVMQMKKENDELRKKLDDFERVGKAQRSLNDYNTNLENETKKLRIRLENSELTAKSEIASTRLRYEQQVKNLNAELSSMQRQCERFKKDRDAFKQMLESAQKKIGDLKQSGGRHSRSSGNSGDEDDKGKIIYLQQQVGCLEDQLCETRLEVSKYKTELISERSANEIKISEMTSKLNEYEEDRLIGSGRTKIPGMKTKLELSWQKEREEQQRLLQETSTLARDLRQTLFEVERERDKERLESKRKLEQTKRSTEEELEEGRKKISELQCDLLELRDAHAKMRTSNEKLRRERERNEREMSKRRLEHDGDRKVGALLQTVDELVKIAPELQIAANTVTSPGQTALKAELVRRGRSPSPNTNTIQISGILARLAEASEELRRYQRLCEEENERNKTRRSGMRRAASTENEAPGLGASIVSRTGKLSRSSTHNGSLYRKSLSLDQSIQQDQSIWRQDDGSLSSIQSIDSELGGLVRDSSMDSRLSGGSTQSDLPRGPRKKKKGLIGKLRSLTSSKSKASESEGSIQGSDSDVSMSSDVRSSKKDLRGRLTGMFKRSGSASRSASAERGLSESQQRPVAVTIVGADDRPLEKSSSSTLVTSKLVRNATKPPLSTTPSSQRKLAK